MESQRQAFFRNITRLKEANATATKMEELLEIQALKPKNYFGEATSKSPKKHNVVRRIDFDERGAKRNFEHSTTNLTENYSPGCSVDTDNQNNNQGPLEKKTIQSSVPPVLFSERICEEFQLEITVSGQKKTIRKPSGSCDLGFDEDNLQQSMSKKHSRKRLPEKTPSKKVMTTRSLSKMRAPDREHYGTRSLTKTTPEKHRPLTRSLTKKYVPVKNRPITRSLTKNNRLESVLCSSAKKNSPVRKDKHIIITPPENNNTKKQVVEVMIHRMETDFDGFPSTGKTIPKTPQDLSKLSSSLHHEKENYSPEQDGIDLLNFTDFTDHIDQAISRMDLEESEGEVIQYFSESSLGTEDDEELNSIPNKDELQNIPADQLLTRSDLNLSPSPVADFCTRNDNASDNFGTKITTQSSQSTCSAEDVTEQHKSAKSSAPDNCLIFPEFIKTPVLPQFVSSTKQDSHKDAGNYFNLETPFTLAPEEKSQQNLHYVAPLRHGSTNDFTEITQQTANISAVTESDNMELKRPNMNHNLTTIPAKIPKKKDFFNNNLIYTGKENRFPPSKQIRVTKEVIIRPANSPNQLASDVNAISQIELTTIDETEIKTTNTQNDIQDGTGNIVKTTSNERSLRKLEAKKHVDFLSDDDEEDFVWSSSSWVDSSNCESHLDTSDSERQKKTKKMRKKKQKDKHVQNKDNEDEALDLRLKKKKRNKAKERKIAMDKGEEYITKTGKLVVGKNVKPNPCQQSNCSNGCYDISEEKRLRVFNHYWSLKGQRKRDWIVGNTVKNAVKRKRTKELLSRRQFTYQYFINEGEGKKQVCLQFLLKTLNISQKFVNNTLQKANFGSSNDDSRGHHEPANKTPTEMINDLRTYIKNLPAVPSHYCRKNTTKVYLPEEFKNVANLYKIYKETKCADGSRYVSERVFRNTFNEYNIGFHVPRKDKCITCLKYEAKKLSAEEYESHLKDKEATLERFKNHQNLKDTTVLCTSFDLQKVLNTPYSRSLLLFYYRKLSVYNLTFYESGTKEGFCYTWSEVEGKRGANEVCSILQKYVEMVDKRGTVKHLLLYSDCYPGQNRNKFVPACLHKCLQKCVNISTIQLNYLLSGHTYMPVDSMHSVIEKSVRSTPVWSPSQWPTVFSLARKQPKPYRVNPLTYKDFRAWDVAVSKYFKNLAGNINKLRVVTLKKSSPDKIYVKFSMEKDFDSKEISISKKKHPEPKQAYQSRLPISSAKYKDILKMCSLFIIPESYHSEYKSFQSSDTIPDTLEDTDVEDETNEE